MDEPLRVEVPGVGSVSALLTTLSGATKALIYAPGAGSRLTDPFGAVLARDLPAIGFDVLRFQFPYMEAGRSGPDRPPVLEATWSAAIALLRPRYTTLVAGGRSMGGRIASHIAAQGVTGVGGVIFFGYPLHPPGRPDQRRDAHLPEIKEPMLFVQGSRDTFGNEQEITGLLPSLQRATLHVIPGGDHSFKVPGGAKAQQPAFDDAIHAAVAWMRSVVR